MFKYVVKWLDANGAGEAEEGIQYEGFDRNEAINAKREADRTSLQGSITVLVPSAHGWYSPSGAKLEKEIKQIEEEAFEKFCTKKAIVQNGIEGDFEELEDEDYLEWEVIQRLQYDEHDDRRKEKLESMAD